jgi:DOPA 4,5-dioxygenase
MSNEAPYHAHIYFSPEQRQPAEELKNRFESDPSVLFVGRMTEGKAGPHPIPQYEVHFLQESLEQVRKMIRASGLLALVHPLTDDDLADHTSRGEWIGGEPLELDLTTLDPPGSNQGIPRFGKTDF